MATGGAAATEHGQFIAARTYRWCCHKAGVFPTEGFLRSRTQIRRFGRKLNASAVFFHVQFSMRLLRVEPPKSKSNYRGMSCEQFVSSLFTKHADVFPALCVVANAAAVLPVTNASPEQGIFNREQNFDKAAEPTFGRKPRPADENLHRRPAKQPDGLSQSFAAVAISANPPRFMSWSSALMETRLTVIII